MCTGFTLWPVHVYSLYSVTCTCAQSVLSDLCKRTVCTLWHVQVYSLYSRTRTVCPVCTLWPVLRVQSVLSDLCTCVQALLSDLYMWTVCTLWPVHVHSLYSLTCASVQSVLSDLCKCTVCTLWPVLRIQSVLSDLCTCVQSVLSDLYCVSSLMTAALSVIVACNTQFN